MTAIITLPLYSATDGVGLDEDWMPSLAFYAADGVTPIDLTGITFTTTLTKAGAASPIYTGTTTTGAITISGAGNNILTLTVLASAKSAWAAGIYAWTMLASDTSPHARDVFANSVLKVGSPQLLTMTQLLPAGAQPLSLATALPPSMTPQAILGITEPQSILWSLILG